MLVLKPSPINGIGVFTTRRIASGTTLPLFDPSDSRFVRRPPRNEEGRMIRHYGIWNNGGYFCPRKWNQLSIGWHLNDSASPNVGREDYVFRALRTIRPGEELTVDYDLL